MSTTTNTSTTAAPVWINDNGMTVCETHAGHYLTRAIASRPSLAEHHTPMETWYRDTSGEAQCETCSPPTLAPPAESDTTGAAVGGEAWARIIRAIHAYGRARSGGGDWYFMFTASISAGDTWGIRPAIMKADGDKDPMDPASWEEPQYMKRAPGDDSAFSLFSLDMTYFEAGGKHYVSWAQIVNASSILIAEIDPSDPSQLLTAPTMITEPEFAWERGEHGGQRGLGREVGDEHVYHFFSAATVDERYSIGVVVAPIDGDLLDAATWIKVGYPLLTTDDFDGAQMGPGHNSFTLDADGNPVIVHHARPPRAEWAPGANGGLDDPSRHARVKTVHFAFDGQAVLNQTREEELAPENREVTVTVTVEGDDPQPGVTFSDVTSETMFAEEIAWLAEQEITTGWDNGDGTFRFEPLASINRDTMAAFLFRYADVEGYTAPATAAFSDVPTTNLFYSEIAWLAENGIATGWTGEGNDGTDIFCPLAQVNRDAMAAFMHRMVEGVDGAE